MFDSVNGLPAHIFFVHAPIVLIPLISLAAVALGLHRNPPAWLRRGVLLGLIVTIVSTWAAIQSGQEFDEVVKEFVDTERHESLGNTTMLLVIGLGLTVGALLFTLARSQALDTSAADAAKMWKRLRLVLSACTIALASLSTIWVIRTGEEGAKLVWSGVIPTDDAGG